MLQLEKINATTAKATFQGCVLYDRFRRGRVLMGRNGVGKTTTLKVLTGLLPARSGR